MRCVLLWQQQKLEAAVISYLQGLLDILLGILGCALGISGCVISLVSSLVSILLSLVLAALPQCVSVCMLLSCTGGDLVQDLVSSEDTCVC